VSDFAKLPFAGGRVTVGPEVVNGTGHVYLDVTAPTELSNAQARELATALIEAADYASRRQTEADA